MNLYQINEAYNQFIQLIESNDGVIPDDLQAELDAVIDDRDNKIDSIIKIIKQLKSFDEALDIEINAMLKKRKSIIERTQWLKNYISAIVGTSNKWKNALHSVYWMSSKSVDITDENKIPEYYFKVEKKPILSALKFDIEAGLPIDGAEIKEKKYIVIR